MFDCRPSVDTVPTVDLNTSTTELKNTDISFDTALADQLSPEKICIVAA
jgi:hypothetical protein